MQLFSKIRLNMNFLPQALNQISRFINAPPSPPFLRFEKLPPNAPRTLSKKNIPLPDRLFSGLIRRMREIARQAVQEQAHGRRGLA